jgi:tRNA A37 N6-isopentenylltransferase MiaA
MANPKNIEKYQFQKGQTGNPNGRPRKYVSILTESGYKLSEINDTIQSMMAMTFEELSQVWNDANSTILEKTIAQAMKKSLEKGSLYSLETLLTRVYGRPKEQAEVDMKSDNTITIKFEPFGNNTTNTASGTDASFIF